MIHLKISLFTTQLAPPLQVIKSPKGGVLYSLGTADLISVHRDNARQFEFEFSACSHSTSCHSGTNFGTTRVARDDAQFRHVDIYI